VSKQALIVWGGWEGHQPHQVADIFQRVLVEEGFQVEISNSLDVFCDAEKLRSMDLIVPIWTMGKITGRQFQPLTEAIQSGVGLAGCHGGMCDAFREQTEWQFMTGGQWVAHPGNDGVRYRVQITDREHPITRGIGDFEVISEQYYLHVDPAVKVLAVTPMPVADGPHVANGPVNMPVLWTKFWGKGRIFYNSLGHQADIVQAEPCLTLMRRGFLWAAR